jgi:hypothetical protein
LIDGVNAAFVAGGDFAGYAGLRGGGGAALCEFSAVVGVEKGGFYMLALSHRNALTTTADFAEEIVQTAWTREHGVVSCFAGEGEGK